MKRFKQTLFAFVASLGAMLYDATFRHMARSGLVLSFGDAEVKAINSGLEKIETNLKAMSEKAEGEFRTLGKVTDDTKTALEKMGIDQREFADRLVKLEQHKSSQNDLPKQEDGYGEQFVKSDQFTSFVKNDARGRARLDLKNTVTNTIGNTPSDRRPGIVEGAFRLFTIEDLLTKIPTSSASIEWVRENVFTNAAAETAEGAQKPQSSITFLPGTMGDPGSAAVPQLFGASVVASNAMPAGKVWIGNLAQAATLWIREGVTVEMSDSDENNFQLNLITIRAERRVALTVEKPAAARYGDLVPA